MDGILNINKPKGRTSFDVVAEVKRLTGEKHAGHVGVVVLPGVHHDLA